MLCCLHSSHFVKTAGEQRGKGVTQEQTEEIREQTDNSKGQRSDE